MQAKEVFGNQLEEDEEEYEQKNKKIGVENPNIIVAKDEAYNPINLKVEDLNYYNEYGGFRKIQMSIF